MERITGHDAHDPMSTAPGFATLGKETDKIDVLLSYRIIELFSEGLYASPNKAIEELVANAFDAGARHVQVILAPDLHKDDSTIVVVDDGEGMDNVGLKDHWLIGVSRKRDLTKLPLNRQQIGKFGIGKLATYVLSRRLTHISKRKGKYYSTSMDYDSIDKHRHSQVQAKAPIRIALRELTAKEAEQAVAPWTALKTFQAGKTTLFGKRAPKSWTVAVMSSLKPKVHELRPATLDWVLRTALPLRDDFIIHLNGVRLESPKAQKGRIKRWILGKDLTKLPKPSPKDLEARTLKALPENDPHKYSFHQPALGTMHGYAEAYADLLTGQKSDEIGRSHGFFVYVRDRLVNVDDGHFGISPDELRHGTFGRFRLVIHIDGLDKELRSNRETLREGPVLETARNVLRAIFNAVRAHIEQHDAAETPGARLARKLAASPASISRMPIVRLARAVAAGDAVARFLRVPGFGSDAEHDRFFAKLEESAASADGFVSGLSLSYDGSPKDGIAIFDTETGRLRINAWHPFVAVHYDEFASRGAGQPLELFSMAEVLLESHLFDAGINRDHIDEVLSVRDQLLRNLANETGRRSALSVSNALLEARNNPNELEVRVCDAFDSLGFVVTRIGGKGKPDGVASAYLSADPANQSRSYSVSLEAKSKEKDGTKVSAKTVGVSAIARQRDQYKCEHAIVVGPAFPTAAAEASALGSEINDDRDNSTAKGEPKTVTLINIDDLARLVRLRPIKQLGFRQIRELFKCKLPQDCHQWVEGIVAMKVQKPPYREIINAIYDQQQRFKRSSVQFSALRVALDSGTKPIHFETDQELANLCIGMREMAPRFISTTNSTVELDQSPANVLAAIESATREYPIDER
ncbi:MAG: ATP-binding protein [Opitutaceae bacterium]|nr:ATP-binding protein [Opitutaceae bacterium]